MEYENPLKTGAGTCCKWCKRVWTTENPILADRAAKPLLEPRRDRGAECKNCCSVLRSQFPKIRTQEEKQAKIESMANHPFEQKEYNNVVTNYEAKKNGMPATAPKAPFFDGTVDKFGNPKQMPTIVEGEEGEEEAIDEEPDMRSKVTSGSHEKIRAIIRMTHESSWYKR